MLDKATLIISRHGLYLPTNSGLKKFGGVEEVVKEYRGKKIVALVAPNLSYLENLDFPKSKTIADADLENEMSRRIPGPLSESNWATTEMGKADEQRHLLAFALEPSFFAEFKNLLQEQGLSIDHFGSLALAVNNLVVDKTPHLTIFIQNSLFFLVAQLGQKVYVRQFEQLGQLKTTLGEFLSDLETAQQVKIGKLYDFSDRDLSGLGLKLENLPINYHKLKSPIAVTPNSKTKLAFKAGDEQIETKPSLEKQSSSQLVKLFALLIISLAAMGGVFWWRFSQPGKMNSQPTPSPLVIVETTSPSPNPLILSEVKLTILNGTGKRGYAAEVGEILTKAGFTQQELGNDTGTYSKNTLLGSSSEINEAIVKVLPGFAFDLLVATPSGQASKSATIYLESESE